MTSWPKKRMAKKLNIWAKMGLINIEDMVCACTINTLLVYKLWYYSLGFVLFPLWEN